MISYLIKLLNDSIMETKDTHAEQFLKDKGLKDTLYDVENPGQWIKGGLSKLIEEYASLPSPTPASIEEIVQKTFDQFIVYSELDPPFKVGMKMLKAEIVSQLTAKEEANADLAFQNINLLSEIADLKKQNEWMKLMLAKTIPTNE